MNTSVNDHDLLIAKLDGFIRKYYKDRLIRGGLYSIALVVLFFLTVSLGEYAGRFGVVARTVMFWGFILSALFVLARFIAIPLFKLFRLGPVISHDAAARIIGAHFTGVQDKLLNTLQLREQAMGEPDRRALIEASIGQRSRELRPVPFSEAIDLRRNRRYLRFALPPLLVLLVLLFAAPSLITGPAQRIIRHGSEFVPEAPFKFVVLNDRLTVPENEDFELRLELQGEAIPQEVDIELDGQRIPLVKQGVAQFLHRFRNVRDPQEFHFSAEGYRSASHTLTTEANPLLLDFSLALHYPAYLGLADAQASNAGDVSVPAGTRITWTVKTHSADRLDMAFDDSTYALAPQSEQLFSVSRRFLQSHTYRMTPGIGEREGAAALQYRVEAVPDLYPSIAVEERRDSLAPKHLYFRGDLGDDHGFKRLDFHYRFIQGGDSVAPELRSGMQVLPFDPRSLRQEFFHHWDLNGMPIQPGDRIEYWFEVGDNDGVNGSKTARSTALVFEAPTLKELSEQQQEHADAIKDQLQQGIREAQQLQQELDKLRRDMLDKKDLTWQDQQKLQDVLDRQKQLQQRIERTSEELRMSQQQQQEFRQTDERLMEKQQQVQQLFENVLSEEMKELYRQVQEMLEKLDKEQLQEQVQQMQLSQEDIEKELDRSLEMFKQLEVEQKAEDIAERLEQLAEDQQKLSDETKQDDAPSEELQKQQEGLNKEFEDVRKEIDEMEQKNKELEKPLELPNTEQQEQDIQQQQQESSDQLEKKQNQKASQNQHDASQKMEQMAFQMRSGLQQNAQEQQEEDMDALRQLLENIVQLSFDQERVMKDLQATTTRDPRFVDIGRQQKKLRDDAHVIEDSLFALSKRVPQLESIVNREMNAVNGHMDQATEHIGEARATEREKPMAADDQQHAMTSLNNLALLLDEALQQMQQQQQSGQPGNGSCKKPGGSGSSPSMSKMRAQQQALNKQLEAMKKALEEGRKKGEKPGKENPGGQQPGMSQQLAQLAAQQAAIRKEMQRMAQEMNKDGSGAGNGLNDLARQMEENEKDIVNKRIDQETIRRQQDITVRLLEAEKAERERELDQKRTSNEGQQIAPEDPARFFKYERDRQRASELLRTVPAGLRPYYRQRVDEYFDTFGRDR